MAAGSAWRSVLERSPRKRKFMCSNLSRDWHKSLKQVVNAPLPNARQQVSRVLGDDHYKRMPCVKVGVARSRTLTDQRAEHIEIAALHQQWWRLQMSKNILEWDEKLQTN